MCDFCKGKRYKDSNTGAGIRIFKGVMNYFLCFDNSGAEYPVGTMRIHYCPVCGKEVKLLYDNQTA